MKREKYTQTASISCLYSCLFICQIVRRLNSSGFKLFKSLNKAITFYLCC